MTQKLMDAEQALALVREHSPAPVAETCRADKAAGRILHADAASPETLPPFDNSAMDGFALGGGAEPVAAGTELAIEGEQAAGSLAARGGSGAFEIMTGARMPDGLDRVIPVENTERLDNPPRVRLNSDVARHQNVRHAGTDVRKGQAVLAAGTQLAPRHIMLAAALGMAQLPVAARPRVAAISTGRELVDDPGQALVSGQIRNSNGPYLAAGVPQAGAELVHQATVGDNADAFIAEVKHAREAGAQLLVSTGAVSMGRYDFIPQAVEQLGGEILFHKLAIRPGMPMLFARLGDGTLFFGLPGNPASAAMGMRFFVEPAIRHMLGLPPERPWRVPLKADYVQKRRMRYHLKARLGLQADGRLAVEVLPGQQSYRIRPLADANAWVVTPPDTTALAAGALVDVYGHSHLQPPYPEVEIA